MTFIKGQKFSEEHKKKLSLAHIGQITWNKGLKLPQFSGKNHWHWQNKVSYNALHKWITKIYGKADKCQGGFIGLICSNKSKRFEWAKLKGKKYERKRENFIMLCRKCHSVYDKGGKPLFNNGSFKKGQVPWNKGKSYSGNTISGSFPVKPRASFSI